LLTQASPRDRSVSELVALFLPIGGIVIWGNRQQANEITVSVSRGTA
jgi:hypothetical protein